MNNIILAILAISVVAAFPLIGDVYAQTTSDLEIKPGSARVIGPNTVEIEFTKAVNDSKDIFSFTIDGVDRAVTNTRGDTKITLTISGEPFDTDATGTINFIKDLLPRVSNGNSSDLIDSGSTADATDGQSPDIDSIKVVSSNQVIIEFSEVISDTTVDNFNNLRFGSIISNINQEGTGSSNSNTVNIYFSGKTIPNDATGSIELKNIQDPAGNEHTGGVVPINAGQIPMVESVEVTDSNTITVTFSEILQDENGVTTVTFDDFSNLRLIENGQSTSRNISNFSSTTTDNKTVVTLTTSGDGLPNGAEGKIRIESHDGESLIDGEGNMVEGKDYDVKDGIPPTHDSSTLVSKDRIEVKFSESVIASKDAFTFDDGNGVDDSPNIVNILGNRSSTITLVLSNADISPDNASPGTLTIDTSMVTDFNEKPLTDPGSITIVAGIAPSFVSARITGFNGIGTVDTTDDNTIITVTFLEVVEIDTPSATTFEFVQRGKSEPEPQTTPPTVNPNDGKQILVYIDGHLDVTTVGEIKITSGVQNAATGVDFKEMTHVVDAGQIPEIESIKITTPSTVLITFSEHVRAEKDTFYDFRLIGDGVSSNIRNVDSITLDDDNGSGFATMYTLTFNNADFPTDSKGKISLKTTETEAGGTTTKYLVDQDGNRVNNTDVITNEDVDDGQAPTIKSARSIASNLVELVFSEKVNVSNDNFVRFMINDISNRNIVDVVGNADDTIRLVIGGDGLSPTDTATVVLVPSESGLVDLAENKFDSTAPTDDLDLISDVDDTIKVTISPDQIPKVVSAKITDPNTLTVEFNNAVHASNSSFDDFMVDVNGETVSRLLSNINGDGTTMIELTISGQGLPANAEGTVVIKNTIRGVESNALFVETTVTVDPGQPPTVTEAKITDHNEITIKFSEQVNVVSGSFTGIKINSENVAVIDYLGNDSDTIRIQLDTERDDIPYDANGVIDIGVGVTNSETGVPIVALSKEEVDDGQSPIVVYAKITDENTLTVKFSEKVNASNANFTKFEIKNDDGSYTARNITDIQGSGTDIIVFKIDEPELSPDAEGKVNITGVNDLAGNEITASDHDVMAGQIPEFIRAVVSSPQTITVTFSEPVFASDGDFAGLIIHNLSRNISEVDGSGTDTIILSVSDNDIEVDHSGIITIYDSITDLVGNKLAETLVDEKINADTPPAIESIEITGFNTIAVNFSEPVTAVLDDFTNFEIKNDDDSYTARNITDIQGSGTDTIILVVSGESLPVGTTGQIDIAPSNLSVDDKNTSNVDDDIPVPNSLIDRNGRTLDEFYDKDGEIKLAPDTRNLDTGIYENRMVKDGQTETTVTIMGTISHANGTKIADALVSIGNFNTTSDSDGNYIISDLEAGTYDMIVLPPIGDVVNRSVTLTADDTVDFILGSIPSVVGTITDTDGNGVAGITIRILATSSTVLTTVTDENGMYSFDKVDDGSRVVSIVLPEDGSYELVDTSRYQTITVSEGESAVADYALRSTVPTVGSVKGLVENDGGFPLNNATVTISTTPEQFHITLVGVYAFADIPPGSYTLTIIHDDYDTATETVTVVAGEDLTQHITLTKSIVSGTITGSVVDAETGVALSGVSVALSNSSGQVATTTTDVGLYTFDNVEAGEYFLTFTYSGYADARNIVDVTADERTTNNVQLVPTPSAGIVSGTVTDATTGTGVASATVTLSAVGSPILTTSSGSYSFSNISPGTYQLSVTHSGYQVSTLSITVTAGTSTVTNLQLVPITTGPANGTITGVISSDGTAIPGAIVTLSTTQSTSVTNDSGEYAFANVPVGSYTVSVTANGYQDSTATGTVTANETSTTNVELTSSATLSTLQGIIYHDSNGNGKKDPTESTVYSDRKVSLVSADTGITLETMTNASGMYMFSELVKGDYTVYVMGPFEFAYVQIDSDTHEVDLGLQ